jgi:hypothetical protein
MRLDSSCRRYVRRVSPPPETAAELQRLQSRMAVLTRVAASLVFSAAALMAVGRYV